MAGEQTVPLIFDDAFEANLHCGMRNHCHLITSSVTYQNELSVWGVSTSITNFQLLAGPNSMNDLNQ